MYEPKTRAEWQEAVDLAAFTLFLDAARKNGLVAEGPVANVARCGHVLVQGCKRGVRPARDCLPRLMKEWLGETAAPVSQKAPRSARPKKSRPGG
jgi:hypothetical protein